MGSGSRDRGPSAASRAAALKCLLDAGVAGCQYQRDGWGSEAGGGAFDRFRPADAELMSAASSPVWTWSVFLTERWLPARAAASTAALFHRRALRLALSGV